MLKLIFLGTSFAIPDESHENTHMVLTGENSTILIDCSSNPILRLKKAGVNSLKISDLILTHFHPDHTAGVPPFLMSLWLLGRKEPLTIHGLEFTIDRIEKVLELYNWKTWPNFYPVAFRKIPNQELYPLLETTDMSIFSSPVKHMIPNIGLCIISKPRNIKVVYSCDTEPCNEVINLAKKASILIHEVSGKSNGHSSPRQAGEVARAAEVETLYLVHYPTGKFFNEQLVTDAQNAFPGQVVQAVDFMEILF